MVRSQDGVRLASPSGAHNYGAPRVVWVPSLARWRMYPSESLFESRGVWSVGEPSQSHIRSALSVDGLNFEMEEGLRVAQESPLEAYGLYAAEVLWLEDTASWRMYYAAWEPGAEAAPPPAEVYASARVSACSNSRQAWYYRGHPLTSGSLLVRRGLTSCGSPSRRICPARLRGCSAPPAPMG